MENEIVESEVLEMEVELEVYDKVAAAVNEARARCNNIVLCYDTPKDIKESKSFIYQLRQLKAPIAQAHKEGKAEALKFTRAMDVMKNKLTGIVEEMIEEKYAPIKVIEDAEAVKKAEETAKIQAEIDFQREAEEERVAIEQKKLADDQEELRLKQEAFERKEREARIAEEAKKKAEADSRQALVDAEDAMWAANEKAKADAINAENARKQAIVDAENAKAAAVQKAKDKAVAKAAEKELKRKIQETKVAYEKEKADRQEQERINDEKHRSEVHRAIYRCLCEVLEEKEARGLTQMLIDEQVPHTTINY